MKTRGYQKDFYNLSPKLHDSSSRQEKAEKILQIIKLVNINLGDLACLDIGCSSGMITSYVQPHFKKVVGIDYDQIGLDSISAKQKSMASFVRGDAMQLPFPNESFDVIICAQVYEHVPNDLVLFSEIDRLLKSNGILCFSGPNKLFPIEPHYNLPFLHWLPQNLADTFLKLTNKGDHFYERTRTLWNLRNIFYKYNIYDMSLPVILFYANKNRSPIINRFLLGIPTSIMKLFFVFLPSINWILIKPLDSHNRTIYQKYG